MCPEPHHAAAVVEPADHEESVACLERNFETAILKCKIYSFDLSHLGLASIWQREQDEDSLETEEQVVIRARHFATDLSRFKSRTEFFTSLFYAKHARVASQRFLPYL